jgi:hypothetical protein
MRTHWPPSPIRAKTYGFQTTNASFELGFRDIHVLV